jgi:putative transposase
MSDYRRAYVPGATFFFTVVTERRAPLFAEDSARCLLGSVTRRCQIRFPTKAIAIVLLPDHLYTIWTRPLSDADFSKRWGWIKKEFTHHWLASGGSAQATNSSRRREHRWGVWQRRFWEHVVRDEDDLEAHLDYVHYNPVKRGWASAPRNWPWSSFHRWVRAGHYDIGWAGEETDWQPRGGGGE